jgi:hypothetical protein
VQNKLNRKLTICCAAPSMDGTDESFHHSHTPRLYTILDQVDLSILPMVFCLAFRKMVLSAVMKKPAIQAVQKQENCFSEPTILCFMSMTNKKQVIFFEVQLTLNGCQAKDTILEQVTINLKYTISVHK